MAALRTALALVLSLGFALPAGAGSRSGLSPRLTWTASAVEAWVESGRIGPPPVPTRMRDALVDRVERGVAAAPGQDVGLRLLVVTDDPAALEHAGFGVGSVAGRVVTVEAPVAALGKLAALPGVRYAQLAMPARPELNSSRTEVRADVAHGSDAPPYPGVTGKGVVVGVIDTGLDLTHRDFRNPDGSTRVSYLWDQTDAVGPHPPGFVYGTEWTAAKIDAGLARERDTDGHGTHVTGIAAGNGRAADSPNPPYVYTGMAPEAEIVFVKTDFLESSLVDAVAWIQSRAGTRPCVINLSLASQFGPHDGTAPLDLAMEALSGPGRILVAAAGNDALARTHAEAVVEPGASVDLPLVISPYNAYPGRFNDQVFLDSWFAGSGDLRFTVISPGGYEVGPVGPDEDRQMATPEGTVYIGNTFYPPDGSRNVEIDMSDLNGDAPRAGVWHLRVRNAGVGPDEVDAWISMAFLGAGAASVQWGAFLDSRETLASPGTSNGVLSVAAYVTKTQWPRFGGGGCAYIQAPPLGSIAPFSSLGPRRDGARKPDIAAPGMAVASALSATAGPQFTFPCAITPDGYHAIGQGTSQASPHVAGAVALMLEKEPDLDFAAVKDRLVKTARKDDDTGDAWSPAFGYGKLDAAAAAAFSPVVSLDLLPGACPNPLSFAKQGAIPLAVAGTAAFGVRNIDPASLRLEGVASLRTAYEDVTAPAAGDGCDCGSRKPDGWEDLTAKFPAADVLQALLPVVNGETRTLTLTGSLLDGTTFTAADCVVIRGGPGEAAAVVPGNGEDPRDTQDPGRRRVFSLTASARGSVQRIVYELPEAADVSLAVFDVTGRIVEQLVRSPVPAGRHSVDWNPAHRANGIYFYRLVAGSRVATRKVVVLP